MVLPGPEDALAGFEPDAQLTGDVGVTSLQQTAAFLLGAVTPVAARHHLQSGVVDRRKVPAPARERSVEDCHLRVVVGVTLQLAPVAMPADRVVGMIGIGEDQDRAHGQVAADEVVDVVHYRLRHQVLGEYRLVELGRQQAADRPRFGVLVGGPVGEDIDLSRADLVLDAARGGG